MMLARDASEISVKKATGQNGPHGKAMVLMASMVAAVTEATILDVRLSITGPDLERERSAMRPGRLACAATAQR
jgi:hypothetical protein